MIKPYYQEPSATVYCGHAIDVLRGLPAESVDCVPTSPPYWGLRSYKTELIIWDDHQGCEHDWIEEAYEHQVRIGLGLEELGKKYRGGGHKARRTGEPTLVTQGFCAKCGAWKGELGLEPTIELYISHLLQIFDEVKRVLKKTGTLWVNMGDSYASGKGTCFNPGGGKGSFSSHGDRKDAGVYPLDRGNISMLRAEGLLPKSLCLIPERFALSMLERGWILRNVIIWYKPNPMPESVKDRFTGSYEYIYFFSKSNTAQYWVNPKTQQLVDKKPSGTHGIEGIDWEWIKHSTCDGKGCDNKRCFNGMVKSSLWEGHDYWFEQQFDAYTEPLNRWGGDTLKQDTSKTAEYKDAMNIGYSSAFRVGRPMRPNELGRNKRDVWEITTRPYPGAHFAVFPEDLVKTPVSAGCPSMICKKCGKAREKIYGKGFTDHTGTTHGKSDPRDKSNQGAYGRLALLRQAAREAGGEYANTAEFLGYTDCGCNAGFEPGVVLDPFCGSGTSLAVAKMLGRRAIGIDVNPNYCDLTIKRISAVPAPMELVY